MGVKRYRRTDFIAVRIALGLIITLQFAVQRSMAKDRNYSKGIRRQWFIRASNSLMPGSGPEGIAPVQDRTHVGYHVLPFDELIKAYENEDTVAIKEATQEILGQVRTQSENNQVSLCIGGLMMEKTTDGIARNPLLP